MALQEDLFWTTAIVLSVLSAIGCLLVILSVVFFKWRSDFNRRIICYLCLADFSLSVVCLTLCAINMTRGSLPRSIDDPVCQVQPILTWYFIFASMMWLGITAVSNYLVICKNRIIGPKFEIAANGIAWLVPFVTVMLPSGRALNMYGYRGNLWCSYGDLYKGVQMAVMGCYFVAVFLVIIFCYGMIIRHIRTSRQVEGSGESEKVAAMKKTAMFVVSYGIVWSPMFVAYAWEAAHGTTVTYWWEFVSAELVHVQGILNFILYGFNSEFRSHFGLLYAVRMKNVRQSLQYPKRGDSVTNLNV